MSSSVRQRRKEQFKGSFILVFSCILLYKKIHVSIFRGHRDKWYVHVNQILAPKSDLSQVAIRNHTKIRLSCINPHAEKRSFISFLRYKRGSLYLSVE